MHYTFDFCLRAPQDPSLFRCIESPVSEKRGYLVISLTAELPCYLIFSTPPWVSRYHPQPSLNTTFLSHYPIEHTQIRCSISLSKSRAVLQPIHQKHFYISHLIDSGKSKMGGTSSQRTLCALPAEVRGIIYEFAIYEPSLLFLVRLKPQEAVAYQWGKTQITHRSRSALTSLSLRLTCRAICGDLDQLSTFYKVNTFCFSPYLMELCKETMSPREWASIRNVLVSIDSRQLGTEHIWDFIQKECLTRRNLTIISTGPTSSLVPAEDQIATLDRLADLLRAYKGPCTLKSFELRYSLADYHEWHGVPMSVTYDLTAKGDEICVHLEAPDEMELFIPGLLKRLVNKFPKLTRAKFLMAQEALLNPQAEWDIRSRGPAQGARRRLGEAETKDCDQDAEGDATTGEDQEKDGEMTDFEFLEGILMGYINTVITRAQSTETSKDDPADEFFVGPLLIEEDLKIVYQLRDMNVWNA